MWRSLLAFQSLVAQALRAPLEASETEARKRCAHLAGLTLILLWAVCAWMLLRPADIAVDWVGWRQADTQAIARNLAQPGSSLLYPRVDWGGAGPGYVETEMQLYGAITAALLRFTGDAEWPGRLVSLLATVGAAYALLRGLLTRLGSVPALCGLCIFLATPGVAFTATSVQPDMLALLGYIVAWFAFLDFETSGSRKALLVYGVFGALAMLAKPTMAQLGASSFVLLALGSRQRFRDGYLWLTWALMVGALALYLDHAHGLYRTYGNTFGVFSPDYDTKSPKLEHLLMPELYWDALKVTRRYGMGVVGLIALGLAFLKPRAQLATWALLAGNLLWTVLALRYTATDAGTHYALASTVLVADAGARAVANANTPRLRMLLAAVVVALSLFNVQRSFSFRRWSVQADPSSPVIAAAARELAKVAAPAALVIMRTDHVRYDHFWKTQNNKNDPRVFYLTKTRGWGVYADEADPAVFEAHRRSGARFYVTPFKIPESPALTAWLQQRALLLATTEFGGHVYALKADF